MGKNKRAKIPYVLVDFWEGESWGERVLKTGRSLAGGGERDLELRRGSNGKPRFSKDVGWEFNVSNTGGRQFAAFARVPVGIDVELLSRRGSWQRIARKYFFEEEADWLAEVEGREVEEAERFLQMWTAKEAVVKLDGRGMFGGGLCGCRVFWEGGEDRPESVWRAQLDGRTVVLKRLVVDGYLIAVACHEDFRLALRPDFSKVPLE